MSTKAPDPLADALMQLAASAAPLLKAALEGGRFTAPHESREAGPAAELGALQQVILSQARRIAELEAEVAALKAGRK